MPLRGYHRVGGPNATLTELGFGGHGTPSQQYPAYGTLLQENLVESNYITIQETSEVTGNGIRNYNLYADGLGGSYDVTNDFEYIDYGQRLGLSEWGNEPQYQQFVIDGEYWYFQNGKSNVVRAYSDGNGGYYGEGLVIGSFFAQGAQVDGAPIFNTANVTYYFNEIGENIPNGKYTYDAYVWNGDGGITTGTGFVGGNFYANGTFAMDANDTYVEVPSGSGNTYFDGNYNRWEWNGAGEVVFRCSGLYEYGTFITNYQDHNYYWDGSGGYYTDTY